MVETISIAHCQSIGETENGREKAARATSDKRDSDESSNQLKANQNRIQLPFALGLIGWLVFGAWKEEARRRESAIIVWRAPSGPGSALASTDIALMDQY